ncbi:hypothetical protein BDD14_6518 [Edaphobacter modestus]|uniref:Uncharacterized protein n=1 Tax=Edaphobacter modestus TaxID=388466 RepID=A0A4Q7XZG1_9BACT|nr:hypothetical protein BDD14_6518 [Edaphobacter modestus]
MRLSFLTAMAVVLGGYVGGFRLRAVEPAMDGLECVEMYCRYNSQLRRTTSAIRRLQKLFDDFFQMYVGKGSRGPAWTGIDNQVENIIHLIVFDIDAAAIINLRPLPFDLTIQRVSPWFEKSA